MFYVWAAIFLVILFFHLEFHNETLNIIVIFLPMVLFLVKLMVQSKP